MLRLDIQTVLKSVIVIASLVFVWPHACNGRYNLPNHKVLMSNCAVLDESISLNLNRRIQRDDSMRLIVGSVLASFLAFSALTAAKVVQHRHNATYYYKMFIVGAILHANQIGLAATNHDGKGHAALAGWQLLLSMFWVCTAVTNLRLEHKRLPWSVGAWSYLHWLFAAAIAAVVVACYIRYQKTGTFTSYLSVVEHIFLCFFFGGIVVY